MKLSISEDVKRELRAHGAELVRQTNHYVFRLANGRTVVLAKTASDRREMKNALALIRKVGAQ